MKEFKDRVAVITGAASGIGRALADRCAQERMRVVLSDVEAGALAQVEQDLKSQGATVLAVPTDVSKESDMQALADKVERMFGAVHLLCNNAGVGAGSTIWESTRADWEWVVRVNLWGVIHGIRVFVPRMLARNSEGHIVNTASIAGLLPYPPSAPYQVTKHAVVSLSEHLYHSLAQRNAKIKVSVACPGWVKTRIMDSDRNRPAELQNDPSAPTTPQEAAVEEQMRQAAESGIPAAQVADAIFQAVRDEKFYVLTHPELTRYVRYRMEDIVQQRNPRV